MVPQRDDVEPLPEPEPLPPDETDESLDDAAALLQEFEEPGNLDDSVATELDAGIVLPGDDDAPEDVEERALNLGELVDDGDDGTADGEDGDDASGPVGEDPSTGLEEPHELVHDESLADGGTDDAVIDEELPPLDTADGDELWGAATEEALDVPGSDAEEPPPRAERRWLDVPVAVAPGRYGAVFRAGTTVIAAGTAVVTVTEDDAVTVLSGPLADPAVGVVADGEPRVVVYATRSGGLFRLSPASRTPEPLTDHLQALGGASPGALVLGGPTPSTRAALLLHSAAAGGTLLESTNQGTTWRRVELGGRVSQLSAGVPPACVVEGREAPRLMRSEPTGGFSTIAAWPFEAEGVRPATDGQVVVALEPGRGVHVSADGGATFRRVRGTASATAIAAGRLGARPSAFTALFDDESGDTTVVWIDAASADALVVADLYPEDDEPDATFARVTALAWDPGAETLWAVGAFGLRRFRRPPSA